MDKSFKIKKQMEFNLTTIVTAVSSIAGALGLKGIWDYLSTRSKQKHQEDLDWTDRITERLDTVEGRLDSTEEELVRSQIAEAKLSSQVQTLIGRINLLLDRLEMHENIGADERERYTKVPGIEKEEEVN